MKKVLLAALLVSAATSAAWAGAPGGFNPGTAVGNVYQDPRAGYGYGFGFFTPGYAEYHYGWDPAYQAPRRPHYAKGGHHPRHEPEADDWR